MKKFLIRFICAVLTLMFLAGCGNKVVNTDIKKTDEEGDFVLAKNDEMREDTKKDLLKITNVFEEALKTSNAKNLMDYLDRDFQITQANINNFFKQIVDMKINPFTQYDTYYMKDMKVAESMVRVKKSADAEQTIELSPGSSEMYAVMYVSENADISMMISIICAKMDGKWKLVWIDTSDFKYGGMDANALYDAAVKSKKAGKNMPAYVYTQMMMNVIQPGNLLRYKNVTKMQDLYYQMNKEAWGDKKIPIALSNPKLRIQGVGLAKQETGIIPMIAYQTETKLTDKEALKKESIQVRDEFNKMYPGMTESFKQIEIHATNEDPNKAQGQVKFEKIMLPIK